MSQYAFVENDDTQEMHTIKLYLPTMAIQQY